MAGIALERHDIVRLLSALTGDGPSRPFPSPAHAALAALDSRLALSSHPVGSTAAPCAAFFGLSGAAANALAEANTLDTAAGIIQEAWPDGIPGFRIGAGDAAPGPDTAFLEAAHLRQDSAAMIAVAGAPKRVVCLVPPASALGLSVLLAARSAGWELADWPPGAPSLQTLHVAPGDLIAASPAQWHGLLQRKEGFPPHITGLTGYGPVSADFTHRLRMAGLSRLIELYGSASTLTIGWRDTPDDPFTLVPHWRRRDDNRLVRRNPPHGRGETPPDLLVWDPFEPEAGSGPRQFRAAGRRDSAVRIGDAYVFPARIASVICDHELVSRCTVRIAEGDGMARLRALIDLAGDAEPSPRIVKSIERWCRDHLTPLERPRLFTISVPTALPADPAAGDVLAMAHADLPRAISA